MTLSADPHAYVISDFDVTGAAFLIPVDAPVPSELTDVPIGTGTLYERLAALNSEDGIFALIPIGGSELLALERAWPLLQTRKRVFALFEVPGARYDVMFSQAVRQIGLRRVDWPAVAEGLASRARTQQRTKDTQPWKLGAPVDDERATKLPQAQRMGSGLVVGVPEAADEDQT